MSNLKLSRNQLVVASIVIGLILVSLIGFVATKGWDRYVTSVDANEETVQPIAVEDVQTAALEFVDNNVEGGLEYYDEQIEARDDNLEKKQLLLNKSNFALSATRHDVALDAAKEADRIASDIATVAALAAAYEASGNKEQALEYYEQALEMSPKEGMEARDNYMWEIKIEELRQ